jgi:hypothetical protein
VRIVPISRILLYSICAVGAAKAQLVPSDTIGNDPGAAFSLAGRLISVCGQPDGFPPAWFSPGPEGIRTRPCGFERRPNLHLAASDRAASPKLSDHGRLQVPARRPTSGARQPAQVSLHKYIVAQPLCMV